MMQRFNEAFFRILGKSAPVRSLVVNAAEQIAADARASAPVDSGDYRDSIRVEVTETPFRVVAKVVAGSEHAMVVESRTGNLARAAQRNSRG